MDYWTYLLLLIPILIFSAWASSQVKSAYGTYDRMPNRAAMTGYDTATRLMRNRGVNDISVQRVKGTLTDHYHPTKKVVNLSQSTYGSASIAAVAVAAHEVGHVMQKKTGYFFYNVRTALVPIANVGSRLAFPLVIIGLLLDLFLFAGSDSMLGVYAVYAGIACYGLSTLFTLVTLPVELDASRRAEKMLLDDGILTQDELPAAKKVLRAAALTYVASLLTSLLYFLRFASVFLSMTRRRR